MHNKAMYPRPDTFDPWRYVRTESREETTPMQGTTFTDASTNWPIWGLGSKVWYVNPISEFQHGPSYPRRVKLVIGLNTDQVACGPTSPGRWHGALVMKMALVSLLSRYEFRLDNADAGQKWWWETFQMPFESTTVTFWEREH